MALNPTSGKNDDVIEVQISISENCTPLDAFGFEVTFDPAIFTYVSTSSVDLTASWILVDGNETSSGIVKVGGFHTTAIPAGTSGLIATVRLKVTCAACVTGTTSVIQIQSYTDDIAAMSSQPASTTFTYQALLLFPKITLFP